MTSNWKNLAIGTFVLAAIMIFIWGLIWLTPQLGDEGQTLHVRFTNVDKINSGTRVTFAGQPVGEVSEVKEIDDARIDTHDGRVYIFEVTLKIDSGVDVYSSDLVAIRTSGLLGERAVDITPMPPQAGKPFERVTSEDVIYATTGGSVEEVFGQLNRLSVRATKVFDQFSDAFDELDEKHFWDNLSKSVEGFTKIIETVNEDDKLQRTIDNIERFSSKLNEASDKVDQLFDDIAKAAEGFGDIVGSVGQIISHVEEGEGTVGRILMRDDFYNHLQSFVHKAETLMDDVNHYGLLFHLDKKWQRVRARRANLMSKLCTAQEFQNFFNDEINQVVTALSRVSYVLDEASCSAYCDEVFSTCKFSKVFSELLRRVNSLEGNLKLYNAQAEEAKEECCHSCNGSGWSQ